PLEGEPIDPPDQSIIGKVFGVVGGLLSKVRDFATNDLKLPTGLNLNFTPLPEKKDIETKSFYFAVAIEAGNTWTQAYLNWVILNYRSTTVKETDTNQTDTISRTVTSTETSSELNAGVKLIGLYDQNNLGTTSTSTT